MMRVACTILAMFVIVPVAAPPAAAGGERYWTARLGQGTDDRAGAVALSVDGETVFVTGTSEGRDAFGGVVFRPRTVAYDAATGALLWTAPFGGRDVQATTDVVFVTGPAGSGFSTAALDAAGGGLGWESHHDAVNPAAIAVDAVSSMLVVTGAGAFRGPWPEPTDMATLAYDLSTGAQVWTATHTSGPPDGDDAGTDVATAGGRAFVVGYEDSGRTRVAIAYSSTGQQLWTDTDAPVSQSNYTPPRVAADARTSSVFLTYTLDRTTTDVVTVALDGSNGSRRWMAVVDGGYRDTARSLALAPDGSRLYVAAASDTGPPGPGRLVASSLTTAYDAADGEAVWASRHEAPLSPSAVAASADGSRVLVAGLLHTPFAAGLDTNYATISYDASSGANACTAAYSGPGNSLLARYFDSPVAVAAGNGAAFVTGFSHGSSGSFEWATVGYHEPDVAAGSYTYRLDAAAAGNELHEGPAAEATATGDGSEVGETDVVRLPGDLGWIQAGRNTADTGSEFACGGAQATASVARMSLLSGLVEVEGLFVRAGSGFAINGSVDAGSSDDGRVGRVVVAGMPVVITGGDTVHVPLPDDMGHLTLFERLQRHEMDGNDHLLAEREIRGIHLVARLPGGDYVDLIVGVAASGASDRTFQLSPTPRAI